MRSPLVAFLLLAVPLGAWGDKGHRLVARIAVTTLPRDLQPWFQGHVDELAEHASDPDHWKQDAKEGPRHFLDMEPYGGPDHLPRTLEEAQAQLGGRYYRNGVLPWIIQDRWRDLVAAFQTGDPAKVTLATAILSHYIADAHVPLHTAENHDGQYTDQRGVHSRWESGLVERFVLATTLSARAAQADPTFQDRPWDWLRAAHTLVPQLLRDDATADRTTPLGTNGKQRTQAYWQIFWTLQGPVVKQQLQLAAEHLGDAVLNAWIAAGKPALPAPPGNDSTLPKPGTPPPARNRPAFSSSTAPASH